MSYVLTLTLNIANLSSPKHLVKAGVAVVAVVVVVVEVVVVVVVARPYSIDPHTKPGAQGTQYVV